MDHGASVCRSPHAVQQAGKRFTRSFFFSHLLGPCCSVCRRQSLLNRLKLCTLADTFRLEGVTQQGSFPRFIQRRSETAFDRQHPSRSTRIIFDDVQIIKQGFKNIHGALNIEEALQLQAWADASVERRC
jgi:hypothetical protein